MSELADELRRVSFATLKIFMILVIVLTALTAVFTSLGLVVHQPLDSLSRSVVRIKMTWSGVAHVPAKTGTILTSAITSHYCTAWFVSTKPELVTSGHCVQSSEIKQELQSVAYSQLPSSVQMSLSPYDLTITGSGTQPVSHDIQIEPTYDSAMKLGKHSTKLSVVAYRAVMNGDIALLRASSTLRNVVPLTVASETPGIGATEWSIGFPGDTDQGFKSFYLSPSFKSGTVSSEQLETSGVDATEVNSQIAGGMSGGPTVDEYGNVLGVNRATTDTQSFNIVTGTSDLRRFLRTHGVKLVQASSVTMLNGATKPQIDVIALAGPLQIIVWILIVLGLIAIYILLARTTRRE